jgi:HSP20 family protein
MQHEMDRLRREMDRMFSGWTGRRSPQFSSAGFPPLNVWEGEGNMYVEAELPGIEQEELEILVVGNQLTINGHRSEPTAEQGTWYRRERGYGKFSRTVELPAEVDADQVSANFNLGVLTITLPKRPELQPRRIQVKVD